MSDPSKLTTTQEKAVLLDAQLNRAAGKAKVGSNGKEKGKGKGKEESKGLALIYSEGETILTRNGYTLELKEGGDHCNHSILKPSEIQEIRGIRLPGEFRPLQEIHESDELNTIANLFKPENVSQEVRDFWSPIFNPKPGESDLMSFSTRKLKMKKVEEKRKFSEPVKLGHTFDPTGSLTNGNLVKSPKIWVPAREWFDPSLHDVKFEDVFTIFPRAERKLLMLLLGRIGVGKSNHIPEGWKEAVSHTARMAAIIVGKDPGLGKSTLFNGMIAAFTKCGFNVQTFRSTDDRFGMKATALSDIAYKDDTALPSLKKFLASEETKTIITNGRFQVEDKFMAAEQINSRAVFIVNSNDWNSKFAYDLDPGIDLK